jgi:hypothetical protein
LRSLLLISLEVAYTSHAALPTVKFSNKSMIELDGLVINRFKVVLGLNG